MQLTFDVAGARPATIVFPVKRVLNGGFAGRDQSQVRAHIEELAHLGVKDPGETPTFYPLVHTAVSQEPRLEVVGDTGNWGEAEPVILFTADGLLVTVGSDHTDRDLEGFSIIKSKQVYPNMVAAKAWRFDEVVDRWDALMLRAWVGEGRRSLFQEAPLGALMRPEDLVDRARALIDGDPEGTVFFLGTVAGKTQIDFADVFECELEDPATGDTIVCAYRAEPLRWFNGTI
jgi:Protein of unknown function (DUF2848)